MKVIDLLNKIANGEESDTITEFEFNKSIWNFFKLQDSEYCVDGWLLNQEIVITKHKEIIEEPKKIEKIEQCNFDISKVFQDLDIVQVSQFTTGIVDKINEIIDYIMEDK